MAAALGILVPTQGEESLRILLDSVRYFLTERDELALLVNGAASEAAVQRIISEFRSASDAPKCSLSVYVLAQPAATIADVRNHFQNQPLFKQATHLHHMRKDWAYVPGMLHEMRRVANSHPLDSVIMFTRLLPKMDACAALLPCGRGLKWPEWDAKLEEEPQAAAFFDQVLKLVPADSVYKYPWLKIILETTSTTEYAKWAMEMANYHHVDRRKLLLDKYGHYDAQKRMWIIHFDNQQTRGLNVSMEIDPMPGVFKHLKLKYWNKGQIQTADFDEGSGLIHVELGPI